MQIINLEIGKNPKRFETVNTRYCLRKLHTCWFEFIIYPRLYEIMLQIKYYPGEGYNYLFMPDYRFYCDEKIQRHQSSYYNWPFRTRIWYPYKNLRLYFDYMPSRRPFREQRIRRLIY
ncbi:uncharacterized protein LOC130894079 [Diorhabda carinulata]|uniref:uncharacterized protein LOC130894079 n=1 Tax=Diorhabda carinulata TaxID=1163345 RepID=UPI0025A26872|nr:uncharacterized protein LOC130894079 [Diorhabda carinulata]